MTALKYLLITATPALAVTGTLLVAQESTPPTPVTTTRAATQLDSQPASAPGTQPVVERLLVRGNRG